MILRLQALIALFFGIVAWHGVDNYVGQAEARGFAAAMPIMTLEQLQQIPVRDL
jgi:hypothetical protein